MTPIKIAAALTFTALILGCASEQDTAYYSAPVPQLDDSAVSYTMRAKTVVMDPKRKIADQDCTQGVDMTAGNLRCK